MGGTANGPFYLQPSGLAVYAIFPSFLACHVLVFELHPMSSLPDSPCPSETRGLLTWLSLADLLGRCAQSCCSTSTPNRPSCLHPLPDGRCSD